MERSATNRCYSPAGAEASGSLSLADLEAAIFAAVTTPAAAGNALLNTVKARRGIPTEQRLDAYRANVSGAHLNALQHAFPVTLEVLGARYWQQLLTEEIEAFALKVADLNAYGDYVPGLLRTAQQRRPELEGLPYLADLASLEWHVHCARFVRDDPAFNWQSFAALSALQQSHAVFVPSHALTLFRSDYPIDSIWHAHQPARQRLPASDSRVACCIHRIDRFDVAVTRLNIKSADLLTAVVDGASIEKLSEMATGEEPETTIRRLYDWIQRGCIVGFKVP